ncbi:SDR family NAD(P)-dependent oxidoreductase [Segnochrobactrum spirostomi]|uniref:SDR family oxidoreductase n=1 Tax=Segnochrobactrum spirostomi TaxID=2608987 RepID=A0A6A7Y1P5_9HYPH|nr:SDR family NAD(P)-dependent oxidoreductase [Segnochrobactrum spirostomi]MQT12616.1 SDR family oxidoreductase [Segnochrobactrum spirostomi]
MRGGRRALVTGGSRGIGRAIAAALIGAGYEVVILARDGAAVDRAVADRAASAGRAVDVTDSAALAAAIADTGPFDLLVNNAGGAHTAPFAKTDLDTFRRLYSLNVESAVAASQACLPAMIAAKRGRIVNIASTAGLKGFGYVSAYVAAKHALVGLTRAVALELAKTGVTVNAVCPGYTDTDLVAEGVRTIVAKTGRSEDDARAHFTASNPMGRLIAPEEVADAVLWLAGDGAAAVTGQAIVVAGGEL